MRRSADSYAERARRPLYSAIQIIEGRWTTSDTCETFGSQLLAFGNKSLEQAPSAHLSRVVRLEPVQTDANSRKVKLLDSDRDGQPRIVDRSLPCSI